MPNKNTLERLRGWLNSQGRSQAWMARQVGTYPERICEYLSGRRAPTPEIADRIARLTEGVVSLRELLGLPE